MSCIMTRYYDYVLGLIPAAMGGVTLLLFISGIQLTVAVPAGAATAALIIAHALFVNVPGEVESITEPQSNRPPNAD